MVVEHERTSHLFITFPALSGSNLKRLVPRSEQLGEWRSANVLSQVMLRVFEFFEKFYHVGESMFGIAIRFLMAFGMSWSHIWRRLSGRVEVEEDHDHDD